MDDYECCVLLARAAICLVIWRGELNYTPSKFPLVGVSKDTTFIFLRILAALTQILIFENIGAVYT